MKLSDNKEAKFFSIGLISTFLNICLLFSSFILVCCGSNFAAFLVFLLSFFLNWVITVCLSISLFKATNKSDLYIARYIFVFFVLPYFGNFFYFLFGFDAIHLEKMDRYSPIYLKYKKYENQITKKLVNLSQLDPFEFKTFLYNELKHKTPIYRDSKIDLLTNSSSILREMTSLIENAKRFVHMEFYLFCDGLIFEHFLNLFKKKISEGVEIRLIIDYWGNFSRLNKNSKKRLIEAGVYLREFNPFFKFGKLWWQFRNHNKILIVDNEYALCGSCNIADEYFNITSKYFQTTELSAKISGDIVSSFSALFFSHWDLSKDKQGARAVAGYSKNSCDMDGLSYFRSYSSKNEIFNKEIFTQFLDNSPISNELVIKDNLIQLISSAKKTIIISTPYFYPPKDLINALKQASILGISIKILVPKTPDLINFFSTFNRQLFSVLLDCGIEIYEYFGFNHEKIMVVDDQTVYVGSYNWDYRALYLNFENALLIRCLETAKVACKFMDQQFKNSHKVDKSDLQQRKNLISILFEAFIVIFKPFL